MVSPFPPDLPSYNEDTKLGTRILCETLSPEQNLVSAWDIF